ncbi:MAG: hypothetical protein QXH80_04415 [Candidatus Nanoarchaeia archaeon]
MFLFINCLDAVDIPSVSTSNITFIGPNDATCGGEVFSDGGDTVIERGVCWSKLPDPTIADDHSSDGSGTGKFISNITGLQEGTIYFVRAYATNIAGTAYGETKAFTTLTVAPTVETAEISDIGVNTAKCGGYVTKDGGVFVIDRGVCWSTLPNPTIQNDKTTDGSGTGSFESNLTGLLPNTTYYVRAYATNTTGTSYGSEKSFTTLTTPTVTTALVSEITDISAKCGGEVTSEGGTPVIARGVCWSTSENPTIDDQKTEDGQGIGTFESIISNLTPGTTYYVRAYATNSVGTAYGEQRSFATLATLEIAIEGNGTTDPVPGIYKQAINETYKLNATADKNYHFVNWKLEGKIIVNDPNLSEIEITLLGDAKITAVFKHDTAVLTITNFPENTGTTNPESGIYTLETNTDFAIEAIPNQNYYFAGWTSTEKIQIANVNLPKTTAKLFGDSVLIANFAENPQQEVQLTLSVSPEGYGTTLPQTPAKVLAGVPQQIYAFPAEGKFFIGWTVSPKINAIVEDAFSSTTNVILIGDTVVTANFSDNPPQTVNLTTSVSPEDSGKAFPSGTTPVTIGIPQTIKAEPAAGYYFVCWEATENATVAVSTLPITTVTLTGDATVTAKFEKEQTIYCSLGYTVNIFASQLQIPNFDQFTKNPNILVAKPNQKAIKFALATKVSKSKPRDLLRGIWNKKLMLYDKKTEYKWGQLSKLLLEKPIKSANIGELSLQTKEINNNLPKYLDKNVVLVPPVILDAISQGGMITLLGYYFGSPAPGVFIEYELNGKWKYKRCKIDKIGSYIFKDGYETASKSCMKVIESDKKAYPLNYSQILVEYPKLPNGAKPSGYAILNNRISLVPVKLPQN